MEAALVGVAALAIGAGAGSKMLFDRLFDRDGSRARERARHKAEQETQRKKTRAQSAKGIGDMALEVAPISSQRFDAIERRLKRSGIKITVGTYWALWLASGLVGTFLAIAVIGVMSAFTLVQRLSVAAIVIALAVSLPPLYLRAKTKRRAEQIEAALPSVLELLAVIVGAGQTIEVAIKTVGEKSDSTLAEEFAQAATEIVEYGQTPQLALQRMAERIDVRPVSLFVAAVVQSLSAGSSVGNVLKSQATIATENYYTKIEERSNKIRTKMIFPTVFLILPPVFIITLTPMLMQFLEVMPAMRG